MASISDYSRNEARANPRACVGGEKTDQIFMNMPLRTAGATETVSAAVVPPE